MKKVVAIGGGSGLATLLRSIRDYPVEISAVVTMTDDGASTGKLRKDLAILPPGDVRKCVAALSDKEDLLLDLFQYRFKKGAGLRGHSLGNLLISAAKDMYGSFELGVEGICDIFSTKGKVLPSTLEDVHLVAEFSNKHKIKGESKITKYGYKHKIKLINLDRKVKANEEALRVINDAQYILIGPGSLYTSVLPNFLLEELSESYNKSLARKIYVCNTSTERGETESFTVQNHIDVLNQYNVYFDAVLYNNKKFRKGTGDGFIAPVNFGKKSFAGQIFGRDLVNKNNPLYHDIDKLGDSVWHVLSTMKSSRKSFFNS